MPHLNTTIPGAAGTPLVARGGGSGPRQSTGVGRARSSTDGFSTLFDDLSQSSRAQSSSERPGVSDPTRPLRGAAARAAELSPAERRLAKPVVKPASVHASTAPTPLVVESPPEPHAPGGPPTVLEPVSGTGQVTEASETSGTPTATAVAVDVGIGPPNEAAATPSFSGIGDGLETSRMTEFVAVTTEHQALPLSEALPGLNEMAARDADAPALSLDEGRAAGPVAAEPAILSAGVKPSAVQTGRSATTDAVVLVGQHLRSSSRDGDPGPTEVQSSVLATLDATATADTQLTSSAYPDVSPVEGAVGALGDRLGAQAQAALDAAMPSAVDARAMPARDSGLPEGQTGASNGGGDDDGEQAGGDRLPDGTIPQGSTFLVPADVDGVVSEPQGPASSPASERALESQLVQAMRVQWRGGLGEATITLRPEHLGQVRIVLRLEGGALQAHLQVEDPKVRAWVESHSEVLRNSLAQQGLDLTRLVVSDQPSDGGRREASAEERGRRSQRLQGPWATADADDAPRFEVLA